jgi:DNA-binding NarL/FixJ family response regulator
MGTTLARKARILVVDDHAMVRDGIRLRVSLHDDLEVCGEAESADEALALVKGMNPDLVIVDISLKSGHGIELVKQIKAHSSRIRILVATMYKESLYAERALRAGASGYLNKQESREKVIEAIRAVLAGERYLSQGMTDRLVRRALGHADASRSSPVDALSPRELEVFQLIGEGLTSGEIAKRLCLSTHTIDTHREKIKVKLGLRNSGELQREAVRWILENG